MGARTQLQCAKKHKKLGPPETTPSPYLSNNTSLGLDCRVAAVGYFPSDTRRWVSVQLLALKRLNKTMGRLSATKSRTSTYFMLMGGFWRKKMMALAMVRYNCRLSRADGVATWLLLY